MIALAASLLAVDVTSMWRMTPTYDEPDHFRYGQKILGLDSTRFDDSKMPVSALNAIFWKLATLLPPGQLGSNLERLEAGRIVTVAFSLAVAVLVFHWASRLYGPAGGLLALALHAFDPNLIAHSRLVTTDVWAAGMVLLSVYCLWRYLEVGGWKRALGAAVALGLTQLVKYTGVLLYPTFALIVLGRCAPELWRVARERRFGELGRRALRFGAVASVFALVSLAVINAGFLFNGTLKPLGQYDFKSDLFRWLQPERLGLGALPVPLPYPYLQGLDWVVHRERTGEGYGKLFLLGETRSGGESFKSYYLYASLFKVPIATQLLLLAAAAVYVARFRLERFLAREWALLCPVAVFTLYFNLLFRAQIGLRFFLVAFPLAYVFCGSLLERPRGIPRWGRVAICGALVYLLVSVLSYHPHYLSYFNELVWDRKQAFRILADSNIDWGQSDWYLEQYQRGHPEAIVYPAAPTAGTLVVNVNYVDGIYPFPDRYRWLREHFQPVDHIGYSFLVYKITPEDLARLK